MWVCLVSGPNASSFYVRFPFQQTSDNEEMVNEIERRVQSLSGVLASPVSEDDDMEKRRRAKLRRFVPVRIYINLLIPLSGGSRGLSRGSNRSPNNVLWLGSCATSITRRP